MAGTLTFAHADLKALLQTAVAQWPKEVQPLHGEKTGEGFWLVGDQGVYLMHNGKSHEDEKRQPVIYARECNPDTLDFDDWWETKRATFGADDGVDFIERNTIEKIVAMGDDLAITFRPNAMELIGRPNKQPKRAN